MTKRSLAATLALAAAALAAQAADLPVPKVMSDAPSDKGAWRMEMLEASGQTAEMMKAMGGGMTLCTTAAQAMAGENTPKKDQCTPRLLEDTASRAVMEVTCPGKDGMSMRQTITKAGAKAYNVTAETTQGGKTEVMKMKISYTGACSANDAVMKLDKDSPACQQARAQLQQMDPATCKGTGRETCVKAMNDGRARIQAMCP
jgi:opacity protein-like surface antigen